MSSISSAMFTDQSSGQVSVRVFGIPKGQPRVKARRIGDRVGVYTPESADEWKRCVGEQSKFRVEGAVCIFIGFMMPRPKLHYRSNGSLKPKFVGVNYVQKPDIDNLMKSTIDSMVDYAIIEDDKNVVAALEVKRFVSAEEEPGAVISVSGVNDVSDLLFWLQMCGGMHLWGNEVDGATIHIDTRELRDISPKRLLKARMDITAEIDQLRKSLKHVNWLLECLGEEQRAPSNK